MLVEAFTVGSFAPMMRQVVTAPAWATLRLVGGPRALGASAIYLAKKAEPHLDLKAPIRYRDRRRGIPDRIGY